MMRLRAAALGVALLGGALLPGRLAAQEQAAEPTGPDTVVYTPRRGTVTFTHGKHAKLAECASCHHESKPEKPFTAPREKCSACHTTPATEPVKTSLRNAFHDTANETGICYACHQKEAAAGKTVPAVCNDCHKLGG